MTCIWPLCRLRGPVEKCEFVVKGDDSLQIAIGDIDGLPGRIGPPQKEEGIFRQAPARAWGMDGKPSRCVAVQSVQEETYTQIRKEHASKPED